MLLGNSWERVSSGKREDRGVQEECLVSLGDLGLGEGTGWEGWCLSDGTSGKLKVRPMLGGTQPCSPGWGRCCAVPSVCGSSFSSAGLQIP